MGTGTNGEGGWWGVSILVQYGAVRLRTRTVRQQCDATSRKLPYEYGKVRYYGWLGGVVGRSVPVRIVFITSRMIRDRVFDFYDVVADVVSRG